MEGRPKATKNTYKNITLIPTSTNMSWCRIAKALMNSPSKTGDRNKPYWWSISPLYSLPKEVKTSAFFQISRKCYCLQNTTSSSQIIASYWPIRVCRSINHMSFTNSTAFYLTFWNTHLHLAFHDTQTTKEDIVDQTLSSSNQLIV